MKRLLFSVLVAVSIFWERICKLLPPITALKINLLLHSMAGGVSTAELVSRVFTFCEVASGKTMYPYQEQFAKRVIRSVLENDGEELTALFSRQSGKSETIAVVVSGLMIILPQLANMPMFADDKRLTMFKDGFWVGIFAPIQRQATITYSRIKARVQSKYALAILEDPDFRLTFTTSNGQTVALSNGSFVTAISASDGSNIEGESFKLIICEEAQDLSNVKIRKCLADDTRILLADGTYKTIEMLVNGGKDQVICFDPSMSWRTEKQPIEYYDNGEQDVYKIVLDNGESIEATINHQFYTLNKKTKGDKCKFRTVQQIKDSLSNDRPIRIGVPDRLPYFAEEQPLDYEKGLIVGYFLGDGCTVGTPKFIGDIPTCSRLYSLICRVVGDKVKMTEYAYNKENGMQEVCFSTPTNRKNSNPLTQFLKEFGVAELTGEHKCLPDKLYSQSFYRGYIESLIETDGCIESARVKPVISFANISEKMVLQLKDIYLKFGIHTTFYTRENQGGFSGDSAKPLNLLLVKSIIDIKRFGENFNLYQKQNLLDEATLTVAPKVTRERSKYYSEEMRFCRVKSIEYVGKKHTYCLKVEGRNFIANNMISSNSIHPMGAAYNATIVKIGTATTFKGDFYEAIQRNKRRDAETKSHIHNHFEYDCDVASKYNPKYAKYVEKEKQRLGENSDEFRMSYKLEWIIERGMFVDITRFELANVETNLERVEYDMLATHVAGIDLGGKGDDTIITICEVDWDMPVIQETRTTDDGEEEEYVAYNTYIKDWCCISNCPDYEEQYHLIRDYLGHFRLARVVCDATREASVSHRLRANMKTEVIPFIFTQASKSDLYKHLEREINSGRARVCAGGQTQETREYQDFILQLGDLQKGYSGAKLVVSHPAERGAHDDYPDSWALAVWGCSQEGDKSTTETKRRDVLFSKSKDEKEVCRRINTITARRRR